MAQVLQSNNLMKMVVAVVLTVLLIGVMMIPIINTLGEDKEVTTTITVSNTGTPFALANADSDSHPIIMSVDGDHLIVTSDGSPVSTDLGNVLPSVIAPVNSGPFNTYYVAVNLASGDNSDDAGEERLSKEKGEVAYYLDADNLHQTMAGYTFDPTLYNVMLVIPPVYWYSELDSGSTDTGKLYIASSPDAFVSMGITADKLKDYAHTYTSGGVVGHAPAIMIGVYESKIVNNELVSQSGLTLTGMSLSGAVSGTTVANTDVTYGTYEVWNYYIWTLYKIMGWTVMGNMDSQYMMGSGAGTPIVKTGLTSSAYEKSNSAQESVSLFIENAWGNQSEWLGDTTIVGNTQLRAGNKLGGVTDKDTISAVNSYTTWATQANYIATFSPNSDTFGLKVTGSSTASSPGEGINDTSGGNDSGIEVGGAGSVPANGLSYINAAHAWNYNTSSYGSRLTYVVTDSSFTPPQGADDDFAYIMSYNVNGTISDVQSIEGGVATSYMPTGTTLNSYWDFEVTAVLPQLSDATNSVDLAVGSDGILQFYNSGNVVLQTASGTVDLGRVNDVTPTPVTVTVQNGVMTYTGGSANVSLYRSDSGTYVYATNNIKVLNDAEIYVGQYQYGVETDNASTVNIGMVGSGTSETLSENVSLINTANVDTETVNTDINIKENYSEIRSLSIETVFTDTDTLDYGAAGFYVPKTGSYDITTIEKGGGMAYELLLFMPVLLILALIVLIAGSWYLNRTY